MPSIATRAMSEPRGAGGEREDDALGQDLTDDPVSAGPERGSKRQLSTPLGSLREKQSRDVRAREVPEEERYGPPGEPTARGERPGGRRRREAAAKSSNPHTRDTRRTGRVPAFAPRSRAATRRPRPSGPREAGPGRKGFEPPGRTSIDPERAGSTSRSPTSESGTASTPTTHVHVSPETRIGRPTTRGSPENRRCPPRPPYPSRTREPPGRSSSAVKTRPTSGDIPSIGKT